MFGLGGFTPGTPVSTRLFELWQKRKENLKRDKTIRMKREKNRFSTIEKHFLKNKNLKNFF